MKRPLNIRERDLLNFLLTPPFRGVEALRRQVGHVTVTEELLHGGFEMTVPRDTEPAETDAADPVQAQFQGKNAAGVDIAIDIDLLLGADGRLGQVDIVIFGPDQEVALPPLERFKLFIRRFNNEQVGGYVNR